jgi:hypothetical protein
VYKKAVFRAYTDSTFTTQLPRDEAMGTLGPPLRAEVNDTLKVHMFLSSKDEQPWFPHFAVLELNASAIRSLGG